MRQIRALTPGGELKLTNSSKKYRRERSGPIFFNFMARRPVAKEKILEAAQILFWQGGYCGVSMDEVCAAAGVNKGSLYHYHSNKGYLALAVIDRNQEFALGPLQGELLDLPPGERIFAYYDRVLEAQRAFAAGRGRFPGCPFLKLAAEAPEAGEDEARIRGAIEQWIEAIEAFLGQALQELRPERDPLEAGALAGQLLIHWEGAMLMSEARNHAAPLESARAMTVRLLDDWQRGR